VPEHNQIKSGSALSRFFNKYSWSTRGVLSATRKVLIEQILSSKMLGRRPTLQVIIDLSSLEKAGKFKALNGLVRFYNKKYGLHVVVMYLVIGRWRLPWSLRIYRGKGTPSPAQLGIKLLRNLPKALTKRFQVMVLVDAGFSSAAFLKAVKEMGHDVIAGIAKTRKLADDRRLSELKRPGQQVYLNGLDFPVTISWFWLKRSGGIKQKRYVLSSKPLKPSTINRWGKLRWQIEGYFKTAKHRFGLHRFGQSNLIAIYRWLLLSSIAYLLAHWAYLTSENTPNLPDWGEAALLATQLWFPFMLVSKLLQQIRKILPIARDIGIDIHITPSSSFDQSTSLTCF
jgi:hypothetical protein